MENECIEVKPFTTATRRQERPIVWVTSHNKQKGNISPGLDVPLPSLSTEVGPRRQCFEFLSYEGEVAVRGSGMSNWAHIIEMGKLSFMVCGQSLAVLISPHEQLTLDLDNVFLNSCKELKTLLAEKNIVRWSCACVLVMAFVLCRDFFKQGFFFLLHQSIPENMNFILYKLCPFPCSYVHLCFSSRTHLYALICKKRLNCITRQQLGFMFTSCQLMSLISTATVNKQDHS